MTRSARVAHRLAELRDALLVEAHEAHGDEVERDRVGGGQDHAERHVARRERPLALAGHDAVDHGEDGAHGAGASRCAPRASL